MRSVRKGKSCKETFKSEGAAIVKLADLVGKQLQIFGAVKTKDVGYGDGALVAAQECREGAPFIWVSLPSRYTEDITDPEVVKDLVNDSYLMLDIMQIETKRGKTCVFTLANQHTGERFEW